MNAKPFFETVRDVYIAAAASLYKAAIEADFDCADPAAYLERANAARNDALETWPLTTRQERKLSGLKAQAELNTPEGRARRDRLVEKLSPKDEKIGTFCECGASYDPEFGGYSCAKR